MTFNEFLTQAWGDHAKQPEQVASIMESGIQLIEKNDQIPAMAQLVTHVMGEHLGQWEKGIQLLRVLETIPSYVAASESKNAVTRSIAVLELASGKEQSLDQLSQSDRIRVLAQTSSTLSGQNESERAQKLFLAALDLAGVGLDPSDPANRALAVTGNNLASSLEEKIPRSDSETDLMILAAKAARKYWEIAGTWVETERAEYRLAKSHLAAKNLSEAREHAQRCIQISQKNNAAPLELFFGYEALALVEKARQNVVGFKEAVSQTEIFFKKLNTEDQSWCEKSLNKLTVDQ